MVSCLLKHFEKKFESNVIPSFDAPRKGSSSEKLLKTLFLKQLSLEIK